MLLSSVCCDQYVRPFIDCPGFQMLCFGRKYCLMLGSLFVGVCVGSEQVTVYFLEITGWTNGICSGCPVVRWWFLNMWFDKSLESRSLIWLIDDHLYSAILRSLEQTHCARLWFYMSDKLFIARFFFLISTEVVYLQRWHGWCHMKLQPSRRKFCVHHTTMHHVTSCKATYVRCMRV